MAPSFIGEIRMFASSFAPAGWMFCEGQLLPISQNQVLFQLIGTTYGGDGQSTFALPDLRGRIPIHQTKGYVLGQTGGIEEITLTVQQIAAHSHAMMGTIDAASTASPGGSVVFARGLAATITPYGSDNPSTNMSPQMVGSAGGSQPHTNLQPCLCVNFMISLSGKVPV